MFNVARPCSTRPVSTRPKNKSDSRIDATIPNGAVASRSGAGTCERIKSNSGFKFSLASASSFTAQPCRPEANSIGKSNCSSLAPSAANRSKISLCTSSGRASCRSILFTTTIGFRPRASALPSTNLVCGSTPSAASTRITAPSTMFRMRSTSPPKSACPGVSTMLMRTSCQTTEATFAKIVMPRSFSRSLRSSARSVIA